MRPTIFCDLDGMVANLLDKVVSYYNDDHGTTYTWAGVVEKEHHILNAVDKYLSRDRMFIDLEPMHGFAEALPRLHELGDVHIASTPSRNHDSASDKIRWVLRHFPTIEREQIILIKHKWLLKTDRTIWFEDWWKNIVKIRNHDPRCFIGALTYPYNVHVLIHTNAMAPALDPEAWRTLVDAAEGWARR